MKRILLVLTAVLATATLFSSCQQREENRADQLRDIKFKASVGSFAAKATDIAFETGDAVGVFALGTTSFTNERLVWDGTSLIPDNELFWSMEQGQEEANDFLAYYPYMRNQGAGDFSFAVQTDQSTAAAYTASDFMTSDATACPADAFVNLIFGHRLAKMVIKVDNKLESEVVRLQMANVYTTIRGVVGDSIDTVREPGTVNACKVILPDGSPAWTLIVAPGDTKPVLQVFTAAGTEYRYEVPETMFLQPGHRYNGQVTIDKDLIQANFTAGVSDWWDDGGFVFSDGSRPLGGQWTVIGTIYGQNWDIDNPMEKISQANPEVWQTTIPYRYGQEFKFRANYSWSVNYGAEWEWTADGDVLSNRLVWFGPNITLPEDGYWQLTLDLTNLTLTAVKTGEFVPEPLEIDGSFSDWDMLDSRYVSVAQCHKEATHPALLLAKVYATQENIYVYIEWDKDMIDHDPETEWVPFHCFINTDGDATTGGYSDMFSDACSDLLLEGFLYEGGERLGSYDPGAYPWVGEPNGSGWGWGECISWGGLGYGAGIDGQYEFAISRAVLARLGFPVADIFSIGFDIQQWWDSVGILPSTLPTEDNPRGILPSLKVVTFVQ